MKKIKSLFFLVVAVLTLSTMTGCEETVYQPYRISHGEMSTNFKANSLVQMAVVGYVDEYNKAAALNSITESEAKVWFRNACKDIKKKVDDMSLTANEETWVILNLTPVFETESVIESQKLDFSK